MLVVLLTMVVLCCQVPLPSQAVSVSVSSRNSVALSPLGVLVVPDGASTVRIHPRHSHLPIFWSLNESISGDRVGFFCGILPDYSFVTERALICCTG